MAIQSPIDTTGIVKATQTQAEAGTADSVWMSPLKTKQAIDALSPNRNLIINGDFNSWQEGTSFASIASSTFFADLFKYSEEGNVVNDISRQTGTGSVPTIAESGHHSNYSVLVGCTSNSDGDAVNPATNPLGATDLVVLQYRIEGYDFARVHEQEMTLSFWHRHTKTGTYCVAFHNSDSTRTYVAEYTQDVTNVWEKATITLTGDTSGTWLLTSGIGLKLYFVLMAGGDYDNATADTWGGTNELATANQVNACDSTANNFQIAQVQLEAGSVATDFESESIQTTLDKIDRYYQFYEDLNWSGYVNTTRQYRQTVWFRTVMRDAPNVTRTAGAEVSMSGSVTSWGATTNYKTGVSKTADTTDFSGYYYYDIELDARL